MNDFEKLAHRAANIIDSDSLVEVSDAVKDLDHAKMACIVLLLESEIKELHTTVVRQNKRIVALERVREEDVRNKVIKDVY